LVDDSPLFLEALQLIIEEDPSLSVVGLAANGLEALRAVQSLKPDLVAMDVQMPEMDGLEAVEQIMASRPTPILLLTGDPNRSIDSWHFEALARGALDLRVKPRLDEAGDLEAKQFREHIKLLASVPVVYRRRRSPVPSVGGSTTRSGLPSSSPESRQRVLEAAPVPLQDGACSALGIVASTGGPPVLAEILSGLPADFPMPILVVQHLAPGFAGQLVAWLDATCELQVSLAHPGTRATPGTVHVAPAGHHLVLDASFRVAFDDRTPPCDGHRPAGTVLLQSLARSCASNAIGLVLTGMGRDGAMGLKAISERGGLTLAQDEESSAVYGMPRAAASEGQAKYVLPRWQIAEMLRRLTRLHKWTGG